VLGADYLVLEFRIEKQIRIDVFICPMKISVIFTIFRVPENIR